MKKLQVLDEIHNIFFVVAIIMLGLSIISSVLYILTVFDFQILRTSTVCEAPLNNRCVNHFEVRDGSGIVSDFVPSGWTIPKEQLVVGNHVKKNRLSVDYSVNDVDMTWKYLNFHLILAMCGGALLVVWYLITRAMISAKTRL